MMMVELNTIPVEELPVDDFITYLRLAEGFGDLPGQRARLQGCLLAAMAALEARLGKYFLERQFIVRTQKWTAPDRLTFPAAPVNEILQVKIVHGVDEEVILDASRYALKLDAHRPELVSRSYALPPLTSQSSAEITVRAGYAADWQSVPAALRQATLMLAEEYYEHAGPNDGANSLPCSVCVLVEPFRDIRLRGLSAC